MRSRRNHEQGLAGWIAKGHISDPVEAVSRLLGDLNVSNLLNCRPRPRLFPQDAAWVNASIRDDVTVPGQLANKIGDDRERRRNQTQQTQCSKT